MKNNIHLIPYSLLLWLLIFASYIQAQNTTDKKSYLIETLDGNLYHGMILEQNKEFVQFQTESIGIIRIPRQQIKDIQVLEHDKITKGNYSSENPQSTRYFFSPNGHGLKAGEGYYQNIWVLVNSFTIGLTDNFSLGGGLVPLFLFAGGSTPVWLTAKFSIPTKNKNLSFGAGALGGTVIGEDQTGFGILFGITTIGNKDHNISFGLGYGYAGNNWAKSPMINMNMMFRISPKSYIISENYFIPTGDSHLLIFSAGGRTIIKKAGLDYGLVIPIIADFDSFIGIPWLGITIPFGHKEKD